MSPPALLPLKRDGVVAVVSCVAALAAVKQDAEQKTADLAAQLEALRQRLQPEPEPAPQPQQQPRPRPPPVGAVFVVKGAGTSDVNGFYKTNGQNCGKPKYCKVRGTLTALPKVADAATPKHTRTYRGVMHADRRRANRNLLCEQRDISTLARSRRTSAMCLHEYCALFSPRFRACRPCVAVVGWLEDSTE